MGDDGAERGAGEHAMVARWRAELATLGPCTLVSAREGRWSIEHGAMTIMATLGRERVALEVEAGAAWPGLVVMKREAWLGAVPPTMATGDEAFDRALVVIAPAGDAAGLFDGATRAALRAIAALGGAGGGRLWVEIEEAAIEPREVIAALSVVSARLALGAAVARREILRIADEDGDGAVRATYREKVSRIPELSLLVSERRIGEGLHDPDARFAALRDTVYDATLSRELRRKALLSMIGELGLARAATIEPVWPTWANDARMHDAIEGALRRKPDELDAALTLLTRMYGVSPRGWPILSSLGEALIEGVARATTMAHPAQWLLDVAGHPVVAIGARATERLVERFADARVVMQELAEDPVLAGAMSHERVRRAALGSIGAQLSQEPEARRFARRAVGLGGQTWVAGSELRFLRAWIDAEVRAADEGALAAVPTLRAVADHVDRDVRMDALHALVALGEDEDVMAGARGLLPVEVLEVARRGGRNAGAMIVRRLPLNAGDSTTAAYLKVLGDVGSEREAAFAERYLDEDAKDVVLAALRALGSIGTPGSAKKIAPMTSGFFRDGDIKDAAKDAVDRIRARAAPLGALSVSVEGGGLAVDEGEAGPPDQVTGSRVLD